MANSSQAKKRIRQNATRRLLNRYQVVGMRTAIKKIHSASNKEEALKMLPGVIAMIDKNAKRNLFPRNRAANMKSKLMKHINAMS